MSASEVSVRGQCQRSVSGASVRGQCQGSVSGVSVRGQCQGSVSGICKNWTAGSVLPLRIIGRLSACTRIPYREDNSMSGLLYLMSGSETDEDVTKDKIYVQTWDPASPGPRPGMPSTTQKDLSVVKAYRTGKV